MYLHVGRMVSCLLCVCVCVRVKLQGAQSLQNEGKQPKQTNIYAYKRINKQRE